MIATLFGGPAAQAGPPARSGIADLLDRRAEAVMDRDKQAFLATIAPGSKDFRARQADAFEWMRTLEFESYDLTADWSRFGDLVRSADKKRYPDADRVAIPLTVERYALKGVDPEDALEDIYYTYVYENGEWFVAEDTDLEDVGLYSARRLWDFGPLFKHTSAHFDMYVHPCENEPCPDVDVLLQAAERGYERTSEYWDDMPGRVPILVPDDIPELERLIQSTFELDNFVAFAYSSEDPKRGFTGNRILLNPDSFRSIDPEYAFTILAHEMLHIGTRRAAGPFIPIFVDEGFADYVGYDADPNALSFFRSDVAAGRFEGEVPQDFEFTTGTGNDIYGSYQESLAAVRFFIERWGLDRFVEFYERLGRVNVRPGTTRYWVDRSLRDTIDVDLDRFEQRWADSIEGS